MFSAARCPAEVRILTRDAGRGQQNVSRQACMTFMDLHLFSRSLGLSSS